MKKKFTFLIFFISFTSISYSQTFDGGFKAGIVGSEVFGDRAGGLDKAGIHCGLFAGLPVNNNWKVQIEMMFVQKGSRKNNRPDIGDYRFYKLRLNYVEMPLMFIYNAHEYIHFELGLAFGVLTKTTDNEWDENGLLSGQISFMPYEISGQLGMYYVLTQNINIGIRLNNSLLPIRKYETKAPLWISRLSFMRGQYSTAVLLGITYNFSE